MKWFKKLVVFATCLALAACQTRVNKKNPDSDESTETKQTNERQEKQLPLASDKKPAESFEDIAKNVKLAAQQYLDDRQEEKQNHVDTTDSNAEKIEEISQSLDAIAETIVATTEVEIVENISIEDTIALIATDIETQKDEEEKKHPGKTIMQIGGAVFVTSLVATGVAMARLNGGVYGDGLESLVGARYPDLANPKNAVKVLEYLREVYIMDELWTRVKEGSVGLDQENKWKSELYNTIPQDKILTMTDEQKIAAIRKKMRQNWKRGRNSK